MENDDVKYTEYVDKRIIEIQTSIQRANLFSGIYLALAITVGAAAFYYSYTTYRATKQITESTLIIPLAYILVFFTLWFFFRSRSRIKRIELDSLLFRRTSLVGGTYFERLVNINIVNLEEYYKLVKNQTNNSFGATLTLSIVGFVLLLMGLIGGFTTTQATPTVVWLSSASGIITEFIAAVFFYLYNRTIRQLKDYHDSLLSVQNILLAFKLVDDTANETTKAEMTGQMLAYLMKREGIAITGNDS